LIKRVEDKGRKIKIKVKIMTRGEQITKHYFVAYPAIEGDPAYLVNF
jgi:hypothetical protein